jgi:hypothetical protein
MTKAGSKDEVVKLAVEALRALAGSKGLKVDVHQFSTTLFYLPVYELFHEISGCCNNNGAKPWLEFSFTSSGSDEKTSKGIVEGAAWPSECDCTNTLVLGLSEAPQEQTQLINKPFIKRLPLWGVALANNKKINQLKTGLNEKELKQRNARLQYWKTFGSKVSLLHGNDLLNKETRLGISLYGEGSTARKLFKGYIKAIQGANPDTDLAYLADADPKNEFYDLFANHVDIALTVQPWLAVKQAAESGTEIEVVYTHLDKPQPFTSLYVKKPTNALDALTLNLLEAVMDILDFAVQHMAASLYEQEHENKLQDYLSSLEFVREKARDKTVSEDMEAMTCALDMISDSRIYYYDTRHFYDNTYKLVQNGLENRLQSAKNNLTWKNDLPKLPYIISVELNQLAQVNRHSNQKLSDIELQFVNQIHNLLNIEPLSIDTTYKTFTSLWRINKANDFFQLDKDEESDFGMSYKGRTTFGFSQKPGDAIYTPWLPHNALRIAFEHLRSQFSQDASKRATFHNLHMGYVNDERKENAAVWIGLEYKGDFDQDTFKICGFLKDDTAHKLLSGYWFDKGEKAEPFPIFQKSEFAEIVKIKDSKIRITYKKNEGEPNVLQLDLDNDTYLLIFLMEISAQVKNQSNGKVK